MELQLEKKLETGSVVWFIGNKSFGVPICIRIIMLFGIYVGVPLFMETP